MRKVYLFWLISSLMSCQDHRPNPINELDNAATVSGIYKLKTAYYIGSDVSTTYRVSLSVQKINSDTVKANYVFAPPTNPITEYWVLSPIAKDTIRLIGKNYSATYENGTIKTSLADATLQLTFTK